MQAPIPNKSTSNLIKSSESAKRKARRRLIGSIFMLLVALIILLNVTAKVKPIPINPTIIQIEGKTHENASTPVVSTKQTISSAPIMQNIVTKPQASNVAKITTSMVKATAIPGTVEASAPVIKPVPPIVTNQVVDANDQVPEVPKPVATPKTSLPKMNPKIVSGVFTPKPTPEDLLNGSVPKGVTQYYIQLMGNHNQAKILAAQKQFADSGIKTSVEPLKDGGYRLRVGPFKSQDAANKRLTQILQKQ